MRASSSIGALQSSLETLLPLRRSSSRRSSSSVGSIVFGDLAFFQHQTFDVSLPVFISARRTIDFIAALASNKNRIHTDIHVRNQLCLEPQSAARMQTRDEPGGDRLRGLDFRFSEP